MKKTLLLLLVALLAFAPVMSASAQTTLTIETWRPDDTDQWNEIIAAYAEVAPDVTLQYEGITSAEYNATLRTQLDTGKGPDIMMARSYAAGEDLFKAGYFAECSDIPGVMDNIGEPGRSPWTTADGKLFAVPVASILQVCYYNKDLFEEQGVEIPKTWEELIAACEKFQAAGITPLANGIASDWDILECLFLGMVPSFIGGADVREKYVSGELKFSDEAFVKAFTAVQSLIPFLPKDFVSVGNSDSNSLFGLGRTAMWMDGSWSAADMDDVDFNWGAFAIPAPEGMTTRICFHPDFAMGYNSASEHPEEAKAFLAWLVSEQGSPVVANLLPAGFYPVANFPIDLENEHAKEILTLKDGKENDIRFVWPILDMYNPMLQELNKLLRNETTPQDAANAVQAAYEALAK